MTERWGGCLAAIALAVVVGACSDEGAASPLELTVEAMFLDGKCATWDGEAYAVAWLGRSETATSIHFTRVSPEGAIVSETQTLQQGLEERGLSCRLSSTDESFILNYQQEDGDVMTFRFSRTGGIQSTPAETIDRALDYDATVRNGEVVVAFSDGGSGDFEVLLRIGDQAAIAIESDGEKNEEPRLRWIPDDDVLVALWREDSDLELAVIPPGDPTMLTVADVRDELSDLGGPVDLAVSASGLLWASWSEDERVVLAPLDTQGQMLWPEPRSLLPQNRATDIQLGLVAAADADYAVWLSDHETALPQVYAARLDPNADADAVPEPVSLSDRRHSHRDPLAVAGPTGFAVIYEGAVDGSERLFFTPFPP